MFPIRDTVPSRRVPVVTWCLIAVNLVVFLYQLTLPEQAQEQLILIYGIVPARFTHPHWASSVGFPPESLWPFITSQFLHGGFFHVLANMWTLWIFGDNVEDRMGPVRYLAFYLLCGIAAGVLLWMSNPDSRVPTIGASGAIAGMLGAYLRLYPRARIVTLVPIFIIPFFFELPAYFFLGFWFLTQLLNGTFSVGGTAAEGVAWWAHVGGFLAGLAVCPVFLRRDRAGPARRHFILPDVPSRSRRQPFDPWG
jgi:membrane associated rhomboid family serine protease